MRSDEVRWRGVASRETGALRHRAHRELMTGAAGLPANHDLVRHASDGLVVAARGGPLSQRMACSMRILYSHRIQSRDGMGVHIRRWLPRCVLPGMSLRRRPAGL